MPILCGRVMLGIYDTHQDPTVPLPHVEVVGATTILPSFGELALPSSIQDTRVDEAPTQEIAPVDVRPARREVARARRALYASHRPTTDVLERVLEGLRRKLGDNRNE